MSHSSYRQVFNIEDNDVTPKIMTIVAEKLAANRAVRRDMTFVDCLRLKYPRTAPNPVVADPRYTRSVTWVHANTTWVGGMQKTYR